MRHNSSAANQRLCGAVRDCGDERSINCDTCTAVYGIDSSRSWGKAPVSVQQAWSSAGCASRIGALTSTINLLVNSARGGKTVTHLCILRQQGRQHRADVCSDGSHTCGVLVLSCEQVVVEDTSSTSHMSLTNLCAVQGCSIASHRASAVLAVHRDMALMQSERGAKRPSLPGKHGLTENALSSSVCSDSMQGKLSRSLRGGELSLHVCMSRLGITELLATWVAIVETVRCCRIQKVRWWRTSATLQMSLSNLSCALQGLRTASHVTWTAVHVPKISI